MAIHEVGKTAVSGVTEEQIKNVVAILLKYGADLSAFTPVRLFQINKRQSVQHND